MIIKKTKFKIHLYGAIIHVIICDDAESMLIEANKVIRRYKEEEYKHHAEAITFAPNLKGDTYYAWFCPEYLTINTITHETDHLRNYIMDFYSIGEKNDSKEVSANLNGYINEKVFKFLNANGQIKY